MPTIDGCILLNGITGSGCHFTASTSRITSCSNAGTIRTSFRRCRGCWKELLGDENDDRGQSQRDEKTFFHELRENHGTGSYPPVQNGWHLASRRMVRTVPRSAPCRSSASTAYAEQLGKNLQDEGSRGESVA